MRKAHPKSNLLESYTVREKQKQRALNKKSDSAYKEYKKAFDEKQVHIQEVRDKNMKKVLSPLLKVLKDNGLTSNKVSDEYFRIELEGTFVGSINLRLWEKKDIEVVVNIDYDHPKYNLRLTMFEKGPSERVTRKLQKSIPWFAAVIKNTNECKKGKS